MRHTNRQQGRQKGGEIVRANGKEKVREESIQKLRRGGKGIQKAIESERKSWQVIKSDRKPQNAQEKVQESFVTWISS